MKITSATIQPSNFFNGQCQAEVHGTFEDGTSHVVLRYYDDEVYFSPDEFVGLTQEDARALHARKDRAYLGA